MLCIPLRTDSEKKLYTLIKKALAKKSDLLEIWLDDLQNPDIEKILTLAGKNVIFTNRTNAEDKNLLLAITLGAKYLDLDIEKTPQKFIKKIAFAKRKTKLILSFHDYKKLPSEKKLEEILQKMLTLGGDIVKIAVQVQLKEEAEEVLSLLKKFKKILPKDKKIIMHPMGKSAKKKRFLAADQGSHISYVALSNDAKTASGQHLIDEWKKE